ncbi:Flp pilus assembly protein TadG [Kitasatospora sp. MAA4]|nr:Flp pilus assembly protein TadG [Kitasatospora sp. MAA4]
MTWREVVNRRQDAQAGSLAIEAAMLAPAIVLLFCLVVAIGRLQTVGGTVDAAARAGARSASLDRSGAPTQQVAAAAVTDALKQQGVACPDPQVDARQVPLQVPGAQPLTLVEVDVECTVSVNDLLPVGVLPGGVVHMHGSFKSVIDRYRSQ